MIYILELVNRKYYVGFTLDLDKRLKQHNEGNGSEWTKKYKVLRVLKTFNTNNPFEEDKYTKIYMNKFGIDNVRGGSYCTIYLNKEQKKLLIKEFRMANNECLRCGRNNHFIKNCYAKTDINGKIIKNNNDINDNEIIEDTIKIVTTGIKNIYNWLKS